MTSQFVDCFASNGVTAQSLRCKKSHAKAEPLRKLVGSIVFFTILGSERLKNWPYSLTRIVNSDLTSVICTQR
jgi:hypothetical protein